MYKEDYALIINSGGIEIGTTRVITKLMFSNLYFITTLPYITLSFWAYATLNPYTVNMWYLRLGHLGKQNIVKLAGMSDGIDHTILPPSDTCISCIRSTLQVEPYNNSSIPDKRKLDLVHGNVIEPFWPSINGAKYVVFFLDNDTKES